MTVSHRPALDDLVERLLASYGADARTEHINSQFLPSRDDAVQILYLLRELLFPGFFGKRKWTDQTRRYHAGELLEQVRVALDKEIDSALRYIHDPCPQQGANCVQCMTDAREVTDAFCSQLPAIRSLLADDLQAAYDGDPAALNTDEAVFCYPGVYAIFVHRVAHVLNDLKVPMIPRIMSEHAHEVTGIDIHPGASIGRSFFIDHGTGVVIGQTCEIGDRVKIYQGVTLGALSFPKDEAGQIIRGIKRHPTIEDDVTIYANAIVLGGQTVIGHGSVIGGSVFITESVPPDHVVSLKAPELKVRSKRKRPFGQS